MSVQRTEDGDPSERELLVDDIQRIREVLHVSSGSCKINSHDDDDEEEEEEEEEEDYSEEDEEEEEKHGESRTGMGKDEVFRKLCASKLHAAMPPRCICNNISKCKTSCS